MTVLDLFSGLGLISLGLHWAGMQTVGLCEIDEWCRSELARNYPGVWIHDDVRTITAQLVAERCGAIDLIAGGFPCQPVSVAGKRQGEADARWLWPEFARIIGEVRPRWVLAENVPGLRTRGADGVLADLEGLGYTGWPLVVGADDVGAPHRRKRVWIVANSAGEPSDGRQQEPFGQAEGRASVDRAGAAMGDASDMRCGQGREPEAESARRPWCAGEGVADAGSISSNASDGYTTLGRRTNEAEQIGLGSRGSGVANTYSTRPQINPCESSNAKPQLAPTFRNRWPSRPGEPQHEWEAPRLIESSVGRAADGMARELARKRKRQLKAIGNSVVPQVVACIGKAIIEVDQSPHPQEPHQ
jgi:DNA (cytosine-5)-methyltransferase 1